MADFIKSHVSGAMCGGEPFGLAGSTYFGGATAAVTYKSALDVAWSTCWDSAYAPVFRAYPSAFFWSAGNYVDVTCRNGDGLYSADRQVCRWYTVVSV